MFWNEVKKISAAGGFIVSILLLVLNMSRGYGLYYSAYVSLITLVVSSILFLGCFNTIGKILASYLEAVRKEAELEAKKRKKEEAKRKIEELKQKRESLEGQLNEKFEQLS
ncbi:MAG: hypothetical protein NE334_19270 [Lentisphaeraceae bacterium]|nr:hypothetical protein [Lentisphaeraceae bacterium]